MTLTCIDVYFQQFKLLPGDIEEHMETLKKYALGCDTVVELGVRKLVSTWAFLAAHPKKLICVDIVHPNYYGAGYILNDAVDICKTENIDFEFMQANDLDIELENMDLLFIDTLHTYEQLTKEFEKYASKAQKYIILHDTEIPEMYQAVLDFLDRDKGWEMLEYRHNNNGLIVLGKVNET